MCSLRSCPVVINSNPVVPRKGRAELGFRLCRVHAYALASFLPLGESKNAELELDIEEAMGEGKGGVKGGGKEKRM